LREIDDIEAIEERLMRIAISVYGYLKRLAALRSVQHNLDPMPAQRAQSEMKAMLDIVHNKMTWQTDVENRMKLIRLGQ
jgi:hypothetical protein